MKIFTREEIVGWMQLNGYTIADIVGPDRATVISTAYQLHIDITVDEIRQSLGFLPHPDPAKGSKYLWESEDDVPSSG